MCLWANPVSKGLHLTVFSQFVVISAEPLLFGCQQGGNDSFGVHCPAKTTPLESDIEGGRSLDVPAVIGCDTLDFAVHGSSSLLVCC